MRRRSRSRFWRRPRSTAQAESAATRCRSDMAQLQPYDSVILANVPKEAFTESQHQLLAANCHDMGAGLVMLGGADSFGAGGWMNTPVEKALPVDMQIKAIKVQGIGAMALIMHASEIPEGNYWQAAGGQGRDRRLVELRLRRADSLGKPGSVALHPAADRLRDETACCGPSTA